MTVMKYNLPVENERDANNLYTKLQMLMDGMLGNTAAVLPYLIKVETDRRNVSKKKIPIYRQTW